MKRMGYVLGPTGAPLATRPVEVRNNATGALITTGATDSDGRWEFDLADEAPAYRVEIGLGGASPQKVAQAPASLELEYLFVRYGIKARDGAVIDLPGFDPGDPPGTGALDPRYVQKAGDAMTGNLTLTAPATLAAASRGHRLGALGTVASTAAMPETEASIKVYRNAADDWAGAGVSPTGALWFRTGGAGVGNVVPSLAITAGGEVLVQRNLLHAQGGMWLQRVAQPTHALLYLGNSGTRFLLYDGLNTAQFAGVALNVTAPDGAAGNQGVALVGNATSDVSMSIRNVPANQTWHWGVEGSRAALGPWGGFFLTQLGQGPWLTISPNTGRVAVGPGAFTGPGAQAQLDVKTAQAGVPALRAVGADGAATTALIVSVVRAGGTFVLGATGGGPATDLHLAGVVNTQNRYVAWYNSTGGFIGYMPLYSGVT